MITPQQGVVIAGRYTLVRPLARGGMGSVWIARHRDLEIDVTVKFMAPALVASPEARTRFEREAKVAARLRSQYVVQVLDYGMENDTPYIAMELLQGESLSTRITREGRLTLQVMTRIAVQTCKALRTAHEAELVHRDLKPGNVFLALKDGDEVVKVLDFGIAKAVSLGDAEAGTESGVLLGSAHYMSPEQIRNSRTVDHRSDLWSMAVILYRALTGRLPFPGAELGAVLVSVCVDPIPPPSSIARDLPAQIDRFFGRALARDPDQRFQSAVELSDAFHAVATQAPAQPQARPAQWAATIPLPSSQALAPHAHPMQAAPPSPIAWRALAAPAVAPVVAAQPATESTMGSIRAVLVPDPRTDPSLQVARPTSGGERAASRSWWLVGALAGVVALAGILGVVLRARATSGGVEHNVGPPSTASPEVKSAAPALETAPAPLPQITADADAGAASAKPAATPTGRPRPPSGPATKPVKPKVEGPLENNL